MKVVNGKAVAKKILKKLTKEIAALGSTPSLHVILIGDDSGSKVYVQAKKRAAGQVGIEFSLHHFPAETNEKILSEFIKALNQNTSVTGFLIQLPLPDHLDPNRLLNLIDPQKDVDCLTTENFGLLALNQPRFLPATAAAVEEILKEQKFKLRRSQVVVVGRGRIAGLPIALHLVHQDATVTITHSQTGNLGQTLSQADLVISAAGKPGLIKAEMLKDGTGVIDVGWARVDNQPAGDLDPTDIEETVSFYTPVPGGVGPLTVACLLRNVLSAYLDLK